MRLGLKQDDIGEICGITRQTQSFYEKNKGSPDANYLAALAAAGADVLYILTGEQRVAQNNEYRVADRESAYLSATDLAALISALPEEEHQALITIVRGLGHNNEPTQNDFSEWDREGTKLSSSKWRGPKKETG